MTTSLHALAEAAGFEVQPWGGDMVRLRRAGGAWQTVSRADASRFIRTGRWF